MNDRTPHLDWDRLNALHDGVVDESERVQDERHLASCAECRRAQHDLQELLLSLKESNRDEAPPPALWSEIRDTIDARTTVRSSPTGIAPRFPASLRPWQLAAAAVLLIAVSSSATMLLMRDRTQSPASTTVLADGGSARPLQLVASEQRYLQTVGELERELESHRAELRPETVAMVEKSLRTIDTAIAEARAALLADPANSALEDVLESSYRLKVDFLKRATQIASRN